MYEDLDKIMTDAARVAALTRHRRRVRFLVIDGKVQYYITMSPSAWNLNQRVPVTNKAEVTLG